MLTDGCDTPSLCVLAGELPPFNQFEIEVLVDRVFAELGLVLHATPREAARALASLRIRQVAAGEASRAEVLDELARLHIELGYATDLQDFYLLHYAWYDLQQAGVQWYWQGADRDNIDAVVDERFSAWLQEFPDA